MRPQASTASTVSEASKGLRGTRGTRGTRGIRGIRGLMDDLARGFMRAARLPLTTCQFSLSWPSTLSRYSSRRCDAPLEARGSPRVA